MAHLSASAVYRVCPELSKPVSPDYPPRHKPYYVIILGRQQDCAKRKIVSPHSLTFYRAIIATRHPLSQKAGVVTTRTTFYVPILAIMDIHGPRIVTRLGGPFSCASDATQIRSTAIPAAILHICLRPLCLRKQLYLCIRNCAKSEITRRWGCLSDRLPNTFMYFT
jgi:hypothetical protein